MYWVDLFTENMWHGEDIVFRILDFYFWDGKYDSGAQVTVSELIFIY